MENDDENLDKFEVKAQEQAERAEIEEIAHKLVELDSSDFNHLSLDPLLRAEIDTARNIDSPKARRRQVRAVVKAILDNDFEQIRNALLSLSDSKLKATSRFKLLEKYRDRMVLGDKEVVEEVLVKYPHGDRQHLRNLQRNVVKEKTDEGKTRLARGIFQYLRDLEVPPK